MTLAFVAVTIAIASFAALMHICACGREKNTFVRIRAKGKFPSADEIVEYYSKCREDRISEAAFICATEVYWTFYTNAVDRYYDRINPYDYCRDRDAKDVDDAIIAEVGVVAQEHFHDILQLARENDRGVINDIRLIKGKSLSSGEGQMRSRNLNSSVNYLLKHCHFAMRPHADFDSDFEVYDSTHEKFQKTLSRLDAYSRACLIEMHKMILKDWRSL